MRALASCLLATIPLVAALPAPDLATVTAVNVVQVVHDHIVFVDDSDSSIASNITRTRTQAYVSTVPTTDTTIADASPPGFLPTSPTNSQPTPTPPPVPVTTSSVVTFNTPVSTVPKPSAQPPSAGVPEQKDAVPQSGSRAGTSSDAASGSGSLNSANSASDSCGSAQYPDQCKAALDRHNMYRAKHSAPPMAWDEGLAQIARGKMAGAPCDMKDYIQLDPSGYQSNAAMGGSNLADATDNWMSELGLFTSISGFGLTQDQLGTQVGKYAGGKEVGHMVNVIFKAHTKLGCTQNLQCGGPFGTNFLCLYSPYGQ